MKLRLTFFILLTFCFGFAQNQQWGSYFSYTNVVDMAQTNGRMYAASDGAVFSQSSASGELKTITSVDGLKADDITAICLSPSTGKLLVGNSTGLLLVVNTDGTITTKIDIVQETNITYDKKQINHICEYNGLVYLSCDFGVVVFNPATMLFGDTYFLGPSGAEVSVRQTAVHEGYIYAATASGIRRGATTNQFLNDYTQWQTAYNGGYKFILSYSGALFAVTDTNIFYRLNNGNTTLFGTLPGTIVDLREGNGAMVAASTSRVIIYDENYSQVAQLNTVGEEAVFTRATIVGQRVYIGTTEKGVFSANINSFQFTNITPNGPLMNNIYFITKSTGSLWATYGTTNYSFTPQQKEYGVSKYTSRDGWVNIPYNTLSTINGVNRTFQDVVRARVNPSNEKEVFLLSWGYGMLKLNDMVPTTLYNETNGLQNQQLPDQPNYYSIRINGGVYDSNNNFWITNSLTKNPLRKLNGNTITSYNFDDIYNDSENVNYLGIVIDNNGTKWMPTFTKGVVAYNESINKFMQLTTANNLPDNYVKTIALDNSGRLWIGTVRGLRVLYSTSRFMEENSLQASSVVFEENGVAQELMYAQTVMDIEVDGSNNKWIATAGAGAYLVSPDGQRTISQFTKTNSPLPSNNVNDIAIDNVTGEVFFATDKGMVSYKGSATEGADDLESVYIYPNPVRPGFNGEVKISKLTDNANVKITDIEGNLVFEATSEGGTVLWDTTAFGKYKVRSGVYMVFISSEDTTLTAVRKVMVIR